MKKYLLILILISGCKHPESDSFNRFDSKKSNDEARINNEIEIISTNQITEEKNTIIMSAEDGIYKIPVEINGSNMIFIFDTGASDITISATEAMFLYKQGTLQDEDILGQQQYQIAEGSISEGTIINLRTVKIGNKTLENVRASVVHNNQAPLLFGQSALAEFGKISIDYKKNEITFE